MKKELYEALKNLTNDKIGEFLENEVKEVYINSFLNPSFMGWVHRIILEDDGNLFISGSMSNNIILCTHPIKLGLRKELI